MLSLSVGELGSNVFALEKSYGLDAVGQEGKTSGTQAGHESKTHLFQQNNERGQVLKLSICRV